MCHVGLDMVKERMHLLRLCIILGMREVQRRRKRRSGDLSWGGHEGRHDSFKAVLVGKEAYNGNG